MNIDFKMNVKEEFPTLSKAPIVEAVMSIQARASAGWGEQAVSQAIKPKLPDYPNIKMEPGKTAKTNTEDSSWKGTRFYSRDDKYIAQFNRDGFVFSHLHPYSSWKQFSGEALRLWPFFLETAKPLEIHQTALRYVNRIELPAQGLQFEDYMEPAPKPPNKLDLPLLNFFHQDTFGVPGHKYSISIIRTIQRTPDTRAQPTGIILDITVWTLQPFDPQMDLIEHHLAEMRYLKNRAFFGSITEKTLDLLT